MKALYKYKAGEGEIKLVNRPMPIIAEKDEVLIKVSAVAICGMDVHISLGRFPCKPPFIMGHEFVGKVEEIGSEVTNIRVGERVVAQPHLHACGKCNACILGAPQNCDQKQTLGITRDGAMAEYIVVPSRYLHVIPDSIPDKLATLIEPMTIVISDFIRGGIEKGDTVAIIGAGQIAQLGIVAAKAAGAYKVIVIGQDIDVSTRFKAAKLLGADYTLHGESEEIYNKVMDITDNKGVDMIFETSGSQEAINTSLDIVRLCGKFTLLGLTRKKQISVDWDKMLNKMVSLQFNMMSDYLEIDKAIELFSNPPYDLSPLITHEAPIEDWEAVFKEKALGNGIKAVLYI